MYRINIIAVLIAFAAEWLADILIQHGIVIAFAGGRLSEDMDAAAVQKVVEDVFAMPSFLIAILVFGSATTVGGGYLAARIARRFPYYHGLAMGLTGVATVLYFWQAGQMWMNLLGLVSNIPLAIWGAHLAKQHMPPPE